MIEAPLVRPRLDRATARRLDRLARGAHAFHRFAHHPLCGAYSGEVIRIGKRGRLCRGCATAGAGLVVGAGVGVILPLLVRSSNVTAAAVSLLCISTLLAGASFASARVRPDKWLSRGLPAVGFGAATSLGVLGSGGMRALFALCSAALALGLIAAYRRRGPNRRACTTCPERELAVCSGFLPIVRRERAFQRRASTVIDAGLARTHAA